VPTTTVAFSNRPQHRLEYTVNASTSGATTTFTWSLRILTSGNINTPYGTGSYNNSTSPATTFVGGTSNGSQSFGYDYRSPNQNRTYTFSGGTRSAPAGSGNYTFTMAVSMGALIGSATAQIIMSSGSAPTPPPTWSTTSFSESAFIGSSFSSSVSASGATSYSLASGSLPSGISLASNGTISGTASAGASQTFSFRVNATNAGGTTLSNTFFLTRYQALPSWTDSTLSSDLRVGVPYSDFVQASNATSYSVSGLPSGGLSHSGGTVSGTPSTTSTIFFTITAANSDGFTTNLNFNLTPKPAFAVWTDSTLSTTTIRVGQTYTDGVLANNASSYAINSGSLPPGIELDTSTGALTGQPTTAGSYSFVLRAANSIDERIFTSTLSVVVEPAGSGKVWNGSAWVSAPFRVWNGSSWVESQAKVWNGSAWADPIP